LDYTIILGLLELGIDINEKINDETAFTLALQFIPQESYILQKILELGAKIDETKDILLLALKKNVSIYIFRKLVDLGADIK
jgi:hypothetical protein